MTLAYELNLFEIKVYIYISIVAQGHRTKFKVT